MKCDETRPACLNCIKWRGYCDSYTTDATSKTSKDIAPQPESETEQGTLIHTKKAPLLLEEPLVNTLRFDNSDQALYFEEWSNLSVSFLSGGLFQRKLWTATMPQLSLEEQTLRYGAMAVGALSKAMGPSFSPFTIKQDNRHYLNAVIYYCEALRLQAAAKPTKDGLRTALLSSLLFICFETQRGNFPVALKHITHGFSMLNELANCTEKAPELVSIAPAPPTMVQEILECYKPLELQSRSFMGSYKKFFFPKTKTTIPNGHPQPPRSSPQSHPSQLSKIIPQTPPAPYTGLPSPESQNDSPRDSPNGIPPTPQSSQPPGGGAPSRPPHILPFTKHSPYFRPKLSHITTLEGMPAAFSTFEEVQGYWMLVQKSMVGHLPLLTVSTSRMALPYAKNEAEVEAKLASIRDNKQLMDFVADSRYWLQRWQEAFDPLLQTFALNRAEDPEPYMEAINLRMDYLIMYIYTSLPRFKGLATSKGLTPQYREINYIAETLLRARPTRGFSMDTGWTWPLFVSAFGCRDPAVRADAIRILGQYPMRNALRDSRVYRAIALRNQEFESMLVAQEHDEQMQWLRIRRREVLFEDFGASVILRYPRKNMGSGEWDLIEEAADYAVDENNQLHWTEQPISEAASIMLGVC